MNTQRAERPTECACGRSTLIPHCLRCGVGNVYSVKALQRKVIHAGKTTVYMGFRCRKCGFEFDESMECEALSLDQVAALQRQKRRVDLRPVETGKRHHGESSTEAKMDVARHSLAQVLRSRGVSESIARAIELGEPVPQVVENAPTPTEAQKAKADDEWISGPGGAGGGLSKD